MNSNKAPGFAITDHKGFQMTFANGYTVSVQFGPGSYCANNRMPFDAPVAADYWRSGNAEMAAWDSTGKWYRKDDWGDDVKGYNSSDDVAAFIEEVSKLPALAEVAA